MFDFCFSNCDLGFKMFELRVWEHHVRKHMFGFCFSETDLGFRISGIGILKNVLELLFPILFPKLRFRLTIFRFGVLKTAFLF